MHLNTTIYSKKNFSYKYLNEYVFIRNLNITILFPITSKQL